MKFAFTRQDYIKHIYKPNVTLVWRTDLLKPCSGPMKGKKDRLKFLNVILKNSMKHYFHQARTFGFENCVEKEKFHKTIAIKISL